MNATSRYHPSRPSRPLPWHAWALGGLFLLYSLAAAFDHVMSLAQGAAYYRDSGMSESQVAYFLAVPHWAVAGWTVSVWGGLCGAAALLLRRHVATGLFAASLAGSLVYMLHVLVLSAGGREAMGALWAMPMVLGALTALLVAYCQRLTTTGVLR